MTDGPNAQPVTACSLFLEPTFMSDLNRAVRAEEDQNGTAHQGEEDQNGTAHQGEEDQNGTAVRHGQEDQNGTAHQGEEDQNGTVRQGAVYHGDFVSKYNKAKRFANAKQNQIPQAFLPVP